IKKARLIAAPPTHHDLPPTSARRKSGITVRRQSQAFFDSIDPMRTFSEPTCRAAQFLAQTRDTLRSRK
ncbi:MAG: hypothetical protein WAM99_19575, partial [Xanthobacteraceae bacterium]